MAASYSKEGADAVFVKTVNGTGPDAGGNVAVSGGSTPADASTDPWTYVVATADTSSGEAGATVDIAGLSVSDLPNGLYEVRAVYIAQTAATGTGIQAGIATPAGCTANFFMVNANGGYGGASSVTTYAPGPITNASATIGATAAQNTLAHVAVVATGIVRAASMSGAFKLTIKSEITGPGSAVIAKAGSYLAYRRIAD